MKWKWNVLNVQQKLEILQKLDIGESASKIAKDYEIGVELFMAVKICLKKVDKFKMNNEFWKICVFKVT